MKTRLLNYCLYQAGWLLCVVGAAGGWQGPGALAAAGLVLVHLALSDHRSQELRLLGLAALWGLAVETAQIRWVGLQYAGGAGALPPLWILVLWIQFASTLRFSMNWLQQRPLVSLLLGLIGGPLAFWAGLRLGAVSFPNGPVLSLGVLALTWAVGLPLLVSLAQRTRPPKGKYLGLG